MKLKSLFTLCIFSIIFGCKTSSLKMEIALRMSEFAIKSKDYFVCIGKDPTNCSGQFDILEKEKNVLFELLEKEKLELNKVTNREPSIEHDLKMNEHFSAELKKTWGQIEFTRDYEKKVSGP